MFRKLSKIAKFHNPVKRSTRLSGPVGCFWNVSSTQLKGYVQLRLKSWVDVSMELDCLTVEYWSKSQSGSAETLQTAPKCVSGLTKCSGTGQGVGYNSAIWYLKFRSAEQHVFFNKKKHAAGGAVRTPLSEFAGQTPIIRLKWVKVIWRYKKYDF